MVVVFPVVMFHLVFACFRAGRDNRVVFFYGYLIGVRLLARVVDASAVDPHYVGVTVEGVVDDLTAPAYVDDGYVCFVACDVTFLVLRLTYLVFPCFVLRQDDMSRPIYRFGVGSHGDAVAGVLALQRISSRFIRENGVRAVRSMEEGGFLL